MDLRTDRGTDSVPAETEVSSAVSPFETIKSFDWFKVRNAAGSSEPAEEDGDDLDGWSRVLSPPLSCLVLTASPPFPRQPAQSNKGSRLIQILSTVSGSGSVSGMVYDLQRSSEMVFRRPRVAVEEECSPQNNEVTRSCAEPAERPSGRTGTTAQRSFQEPKSENKL